MELSNVINNLRKVKGLSNIKLLAKKDKEFILKNEDSKNIGVFDCLNRSYTLMLVHDSTFRKPSGKIVINKKGKIHFPSVKFPEIKAINAVSSSPSIKIHEYLVKRFKLKLKDEATLLIGFDLS